MCFYSRNIAVRFIWKKSTNVVLMLPCPYFDWEMSVMLHDLNFAAEVPPILRLSQSVMSLRHKRVEILFDGCCLDCDRKHLSFAITVGMESMGVPRIIRYIDGLVRPVIGPCRDVVQH